MGTTKESPQVHEVRKTRSDKRHLPSEELRQRIGELEKEVARMERRALRAESAVTALLTSTSWKLTRPVRGIRYTLDYCMSRGYAILRRSRRVFDRRHVGSGVLAGQTPLSSSSMIPGEEETSDSAPALRPVADAVECAVVIAVYNAADDVQKCLASVLRHAAPDLKVIVVDDCSPDPAITPILDPYRSLPNWTIVSNPENLGYTRTVNVGLRTAGSADVIILNSDTIVTPLWFQRLRYAAYAEPDIGTVTPVSNNAGAFSVPQAGTANDRPEGFSLDAYARAIARELGRATIDTPTGNGFCMYMKREVIDRIGLFDEEAFPRGYGEENDWCQRAVAAGWRNIIDFTTYIYHKRSASFGSAKTDLMAHGRAIVDNRYPSYKSDVRLLGKNPDAAGFRARIAEIEKTDAVVRPRLLFVISTTTGGTPQTNLDLMREVDGDCDCFVLRCDSRMVEFSHLVGGKVEPIQRHDLSEPIRPFPHRSDEYDRVVLDYLVKYAIDIVHIRHVGWHSLGLIDVAKNSGSRVIFSFHDFYTVCPSIKLLDENWKYCAGTCSSSSGDCAVELWNKALIPDLKHRNIKVWRRTMEKSLLRCDAFVTTSPRARGILIANFPWLAQRDFRVVPHGRNLTFSNLGAGAPAPGEKLRILVLGNINVAKGNDVYRQLAKRFPEWDVQFHFLGKWQGAQISHPDYVYHGAYSRDDLAVRIADIRPHCAAILSIWPETYCHTLTECWAHDIPCFGFNIGAVGERITEAGGGWLIDDFSADAFHASVEDARGDRAGWERRLREISDWQANPTANSDCATMALQYRDIYRQSLPVGVDAGTL